MAAICKGDVWLADMPEGVGHEQKGKRPVIIVASVPEMKMAVVVPLTSNSNSLRFPFTLKILPCNENGLYTESVAMVFQMQAIDCVRLLEKMGKMHEQEFDGVGDVIKALLFPF